MIRDRFSRMNKFRKRAFAVALATAVASTSFNIGSLAANAGTSARGRVIVAFEELPGDIVEQTLPIGGKKTDLNLPEELDVLLYSEEAEKEGRKKETVSKDRTDDAAETPTESPADEKQSEGATEAASEESQDSNTDTANTDTGSANDGSAVTPDSRNGDTASEPTDETGTDGGSTDSQPAEGGDSTGETGEDTVDTSGRLTDRMLTAVGSTFIPVKAYAAEPATEESEETESGAETQGDGAADTVHAVQPSANSASDTGADEAADKGGKKTDEESSVEPETGSATEAASEPPAGSSGRTAAEDSSDDNKGKVTRLADGERRTLEDVRWKLVRDKSEYGSRFQAIREGDVFYFAPDIKAYGLKSDVDLPEIKVTIVAAEDETASGNGISGNAISGNGVSENSISGNTVSENSYPEFDQFMIVSGVKVSVTAPEGVFPEGAMLKVKKIDDAASNEKIEQAVKEDMGLSDAAEVNGVRPDGADSEAGDPDGSSASAGEALSYISFDITITDVSGNEIQPNTEHGKANVTFSQADIISEYIEAPGEETEGKLGAEEETGKDEGNGDNPESRKTKDGGRVFIIGDDTDTGASSSKKSLRMYHFDDDLETVEKLDTTLDEAGRAVGAEAEHFSTYTAAIGTSEDYDAGTFGEFKISCTGARVEIMCKNASGDVLDDPFSSQIRLVELNVIPSLGSEPFIDIRSASNDGAYINQYLLFTGGDSGVDSTVRLSKFVINMYHNEGPAIEIKKFQRLKLILDDFKISQAGGCTGIVRDNESTGGSIHLLGAKIGTGNSGWDPINLGKITSEFKIYSNSEENAIYSWVKPIILSDDSENKLYFEAEDDDPNARLEIKVDGGSIIGGKGEVYFNGGKYNIIKSGEQYPEFGNSIKVIINGGFINAKAIFGNRSNIEFKGGTHEFDERIISTDTDHANITHIANGGSIKLKQYSGSVTFFPNKYNGDTNYYLHTVQLRDALGNAVADTPIDAVTGLGSYGINDVYTDADGKLYLWYAEDSSNKLTSVTAGGTEYVYLKQTDATIDETADAGKYAAKEKTSVFGPYIPLEDLELDKTKLLAADNPLKPLLTFNKKYTGDAVDSSGIYHRLKDIKWTIEPDNSPGRITDDQKEEVAVNLSGGSSFKLTAKLNDTLHNYEKEWVFYLPKYVPVDSIKLAEEVILKCETEYTLDGIDVIGTTATVEPDDATFNTIVWSVKDPAGNAVTLTDKKFKPTVVGDYTITATVANGKTETTPYTQDFKVACKREIKANLVTVSPTDNPYTGKEVKPSVIIKDDDGTVLTEGTDYTVEYKNNINKTTDTSKAKVVIKGKGLYTTADEGLSIEFNIADLPTGTIKVADPVLSYNALQTEDKVAAYVKNAASITIEGKGSDGTTPLTVDKIKYYISDTYYGTTAELNAAVAVTAWTGYAAFTTKQDQKNYIYAKLTDGADTYISTQCIVDDRTPPDKPVISSGTVVGTTGTVTIYANDTLSGIADYYVMAVKKGATAPTADQVKANGFKSSSSPVKVSGLSSSQEYTFYAVTEDKAGNISAISDGKDSTVGKGSITGRISVMGHNYDKLQGKQETDDYTNETKEIKITGAADNGVAKIEYFITDKFYSSASAIEGAAKETKGSGNAAFVVSNWATYNDSARPYLLKNKLNYIYAKITDNGGGVTYISSKGIWEDEINPTTSSTSSTPKDTTAASTVKGTDKESGVKNYYLLVRKATDSAPSKAEDVKSAGMKSEDGKFSLTGLTANTKYTVYTVTEDRAGNLSAIKKTSFTTKKATDANADAAKKAAAASAAAAAAAGGGSGSTGKTGSGSNVAKRTAGAGGSGSVSDNGDGDSDGSDTIRDGVPFIEDATDGILIGRENTSGWERIESEAGKASQPSQIHVDMNGSTVVPAAALRQCRDRDITYYFRLNDDITWAVNGLSFTADPGDIDFRVRTDTRNIPSKLVNEVADVYPHTNLTIEHDGDFGFTAILSVNMGSDNEGMYANLYYYDEGNNALNFMDSTEVDGGGRASFEFLHASDYTVILRGDALTDKSAAALTDDSFMSTGDASATSGGPVNVSRNTGNLWLIVVSVISFLLCGLILFMPDKRNRKRGPANAVS